ncbi:hypothetical protein AKO1_015145, partial [Acrasis kona]
ERLFHNDQYIQEFTTVIVEKTSRKIDKNTTKSAIILKSTAFYPTSGGQLNDIGSITFSKNNKVINVIDVIEEKHNIIHILDSVEDDAIVGDEVQGKIDWQRRLDHMQQHHGQHILSSAFIQVSGISTVAFHMSSSVSNIDLEVDKISEDVIIKVQDAANQVIIDARPVEITQHTIEEANKLPLRKKLDATLEEPIRIINIKDYDLQPCCGTHPNNTSQVQSIVILGCESIKKQTRLYFICGTRVTNYARQASSTFSSLGKHLSCSSSTQDVTSAVEAQIESYNQLKKTCNDYEKIVLRSTASELFQTADVTQSGSKLIVSELKGKDMRFMRAVAKEAVFSSNSIVCLYNCDAETQFVINCSTDLKQVDLRQVVKSLFVKVNGKGGGQAVSVTGTLKTNNSKLVHSECHDILNKL